MKNEITKNPANHGAAFCPIILGSDKTTVLVATGQNEYYPLYMSNGVVYNNVRRAHRNALTLVGFLAIPKSEYLTRIINCQIENSLVHYQQTRSIKTVPNFASFDRICFMGLSEKSLKPFNQVWRHLRFCGGLMDTTAELSLGLVLTLQITQSKSSWHASCRVGELIL